MTTAAATTSRRWGLILLAGLAVSQSGCLLAACGAAAGAGAYAYYRGNVSETCAVEFGDAYQSTKEAMLDLAMPVLHEEHQGVTGTIESSLQDGTKVTVVLEEKPRQLANDPHQTEVGVRIGTFGDEKASTKILRQIGVRTAQRSKAPTGTVPGRLPPISADGAVQQTSLPPALATGTTAAPGNGQWKPAGAAGGEAPKPQ
jgi:hypothetical protein